MPIDILPGDLTVLTRDLIKARYLRDYANRSPEADTGTNTLPDHDASLFADGMMPLMANAIVIARATDLDGQTGERLNRTGAAEGVERPIASTASGYATITTSAGGTTIQSGDELTEPNTSNRYRCTATALYVNGQGVPIESVDTGPELNLEAGTRLVWTSPRAGCAKDAVVAEDINGSGLSGGRVEATDEEYIAEIKVARANPPASGNDAEVRRVVRKIRGLRVEEVFTYPAIWGSGTIAVVFTIRPSLVGGSRIPSALQMGNVEATLTASIQTDDSFFVCTIIQEPVEIGAKITWARGATGWADVAPWPSWAATNQMRVKGSPAPTPTSFRVYTAGSSTAPQPGQSIGLFDPTAKLLGPPARIGRFRNKRILSVTEISPNQEWALTIDTSNGASDTSFVPVADSLVSPWSDSLDSLVPSVLGAMGSLGPGEQVSMFYDPGRRQRRCPKPIDAWPNKVTNLLVSNAIFDSGLVGDADLVMPETLPLSPSTGIRGVASYLLALGGLAFYQQ